MISDNEFFLIFLGTIIVVRLFLLLKPIPSPTVGGFRIHHYMYGLVAMFVGLLLHTAIIYAIGLGLFVDELTYLIIGGKTHADNYSIKSIVGTLVFILVVLIFRKYVFLSFL